MGEVPEALRSSVVLFLSYKDIIICIASSALAGIGVGFFSCLLSSADKQRQLNGGKHTDRSRIRCVLGAIGSTIFGILSLVGLNYGPVALVVVVRAGATLPANALFSQVFQIRPLTSSDALGTLVTLSGHTACAAASVNACGVFIVEASCASRFFRVILDQRSRQVFLFNFFSARRPLWSVEPCFWLCFSRSCTCSGSVSAPGAACFEGITLQAGGRSSPGDQRRSPRVPVRRFGVRTRTRLPGRNGASGARRPSRCWRSAP